MAELFQYELFTVCRYAHTSYHSHCCYTCGFDDVRLVYDRETGKPKGYGFCEYQDLETAQSAMRNLNNHDFNGRPLRVGVAAGEQTKDENRGMQQALGGPAAEVMFYVAYV